MRKASFFLLFCGLTGTACTAGSEPSAESVGATTSANPVIVVKNGLTQPQYAVAEAVREVVYVEAAMDSDGDGRPDRIAVDIMRPKTADGMKVAVVMEASPYYRTGRSKPKDRPVMVPEAPIPFGHHHWYDAYFVQRGYATVEVEMQGTGRSEGCPMTGGKEDTLSIVAAIDWLNGRARGFDENGVEKSATWSTGAVGMVGLSYNGTLPIAVATQGTEGLKTIVPLGAISSWYDYTRDHGIGFSNWDRRYPEMLANYVSSAASDDACRDKIRQLGDDAGDDSYDLTPFWQERDYRKDIAKIRASVFAVHGLRDYNVKVRHFSRFWEGIAAANVPRKVWLHRDGHTDPSYVRAPEWKAVLHRWMDHWLYGIENGVMNEPMADVEREDGTWHTQSNWPANGTQEQAFFPSATGALEGTASAPAAQSLVDTPTAIGQLVRDPLAPAAYRLAYLGAPLAAPVRISGSARMRVSARIGSTSSPITAILVDYGTQTVREPLDFAADDVTNCGNDGLLQDPGCAAPPTRATTVTSQVVVSQGAIDLKNHASLSVASVLTPGDTYTAEWDLEPTDYVFAQGHSIGLVLAANARGYVSNDPLAGEVTVALDATKLTIPISPLAR